MTEDPTEIAAELVEAALSRIDQRVTEKGLQASLVDWVGTLYVRAGRLTGYSEQVQASANQLVVKYLRQTIAEIKGSPQPFLPNVQRECVESLLALIMYRDDSSDQMIALGDDLIVAALRKGLHGTGHGQILEATLPAMESLLKVAEEWRSFRSRR